MDNQYKPWQKIVAISLLEGLKLINSCWGRDATFCNNVSIRLLDELKGFKEQLKGYQMVTGNGFNFSIL